VCTCPLFHVIYRGWQELDYRIDICRVTKGRHIEHLYGRTENWSVSLFVDMLPFGVTIPATVPQRSEIPEGLMNYPVLCLRIPKSKIILKMTSAEFVSLCKAFENFPFRCTFHFEACVCRNTRNLYTVHDFVIIEIAR
jgi:hypothetical protein